jgi:hypothetical protein
MKNTSMKFPIVKGRLLFYTQKCVYDKYIVIVRKKYLLSS